MTDHAVGTIVPTALSFVQKKYRVREVERIVNRLKFIYGGKYNVISTYHGVSIRGENVTHLTISNACDLGGVIKALDDLICKD